MPLFLVSTRKQKCCLCSGAFSLVAEYLWLNVLEFKAAGVGVKFSVLSCDHVESWNLCVMNREQLSMDRLAAAAAAARGQRASQATLRT